MTDAEIVRYLAEKVMGWTVIPFDAEDRKEGVFPRLVEQIVLGKYWLRMHEDGPTQGRAWNPLESIADAVEVQMKVPADKQRAVGVEAARLVKENAGGLWSGVSDWDMLCVNARGRCLAIVEATR